MHDMSYDMSYESIWYQAAEGMWPDPQLTEEWLSIELSCIMTSVVLMGHNNSHNVDRVELTLR